MTLLDDILPVAYSARGIAGSLGFRPYTVALLIDWYANGEWAGPESVPLVEGSGQPPKVVQEKFQDLPIGAQPPDIILVGPITPFFPGGGTDLTDWLAPVFDGATRHLLLTGPSCPDGKKYRILRIDTQKALRYMIRAQDEAQFMRGLGGI